MMNEKESDYQQWEDKFNKEFKWLTSSRGAQVIDYSEAIMGRIEQHELDHGALFIEITGAPGAGKTATLLSCIERSLKKFPKEKVFLSECYNTPIQATKLGRDKYHLLVENTDRITFHDRNNNGKQIQPEISYFNSFDEAYRKARYGVANVIFFDDRMKMIEFIGHMRTMCEWCHVFVDEISEIAPAFASGDAWRRIEKFSFILKDIRKTCINVYATTQSVIDTDARVRTKIMTKIYLPGSIRDKHSRVTQIALDNLKEDRINGNEGYIEYFGRFCKTRFNKIYRPDPDNLIDARVRELTPEEKQALEEDDK